MIEVVKYTQEKEREWNDFVSQSKNGTFLFDRRYMDYHSDRFEDFSLMVYRKNALYAILPAHRTDNTLCSHQGLTYGGYLIHPKVTTSGMLETVQQVNSYLLSAGMNKMIYKSIPFIYHLYPSQEDLYAFFRYCQVKTIGCNIASVIFQHHKLKFDSSRKYGIHKASTLGLKVVESTDFAAFWAILQSNLNNKYGIKPVHSLAEIELLHSRFPDNIKLFLVYKGETVVGGTVIYITTQVIRAQYSTASPEGKDSGALDVLFAYLINEKYRDYPYIDFGHSTEQMGNYLNENLIFQKEGFGARGIVYDIYEISF